MKRHLLRLLVFFFFCYQPLVFAGPDTNGRLYVKKGSTGTGSSWADAYGELSDALKYAINNPGTVNQIWVAGGKYIPLYTANNSTNDRARSFVIPANTAVYGNFAGTEIALADRDITNTANTSTLSGDLGVISGSQTNALHVVIAGGNLNNIILDGFTISDGIANDGTSNINVNGVGFLSNYGGGIFISASAANTTPVILKNLIVTKNSSTMFGGGIVSFPYVNLVMDNVQISNNKSSSAGGIAIAFSANNIITNTVMSNNTADHGGAMYVQNSNVTLKYADFKDNKCLGYGGAIFMQIDGNLTGDHLKIQGNTGIIGGGIYSSTGSVNITDALLSGNFASNSGGAAQSLNSTNTFINTTIAGNSSPAAGSLYIDGGSTNIYNTVISGNSSQMVANNTIPNVSNVLIEGTPTLTGTNILSGSLNPQFVSPVAPSFSATTQGNYQLSGASPLIDKGNNASYNGLSATSRDLAGNLRVTNFGSGGIIDIGAYESNYKPQTVTASNITKTYGDVPFEPGATASSGLPVSYTSADDAIAKAYQDAADGNKWKISIKKAGTVTITAYQGGDDVYASASTTFTLTINKAPLTITAVDVSKTYDGIAYDGVKNTVTYKDFVYGEDKNVLQGTLSYTGTADQAVNAGTYDIIPGGLTADNYDIEFKKGTLTINKAPLTITANDDSKIYDGLAYAGGNGVTYTGFVNNEDEHVLSGTLAYTGTSQNAISVGNSYVITPGGLTADNYAISYTDGKLEITKASLTITANDDSKIYDGLAYAGGNGVTYAGFVNSEDENVLSGTLAYTGTSQNAINVGNSYVITVGGLTADNYTISYTEGKLDITKAPLTITANDDSKIYDGLAYAGGKGLTYTGFVNNEDEHVLSGTLAYTGTSQNAISVGSSYVITPGGLTADNYAISYTDGKLEITKASLTITANDDSKIYDGLAYSGGKGVTYAGFVNSEDENVLSGTLTYTGTSQNAINVGNSYVITPGGLTADNYAISYTDGKLEVTKAALTITANDDSKIYDGLPYTGGKGVTYAGFVNNEDETVLAGALTYTGTSQSAINAGNGYTIMPTGYTSDNYDINYKKGNLDITKAALTVTAGNESKVYDGQPFSGGNVTYSGFVNNETASVLTGILSYSGSSQGAINAGNSYVITPGGLSSGNYTIDFADGTLAITKAPLTITAADASKTYDGQVYSGGYNVTYTGFVPGDTRTVLGGSLVYTGTSQTAINTGNAYTIIPGGLTSDNYDIGFVNGTLTINPAVLIVTANDDSRTYNGLPYTGGNDVNYNGFVPGESKNVLNGTLSYTGTSQGAINAGTGYIITPGGLTASNYTIQFQNGTLTIGKAPLTITANDDSKTYDGLAYSGGKDVTYSGFVNNETKNLLGGTLTYTGTSQGAINAGNGYTIMPTGYTSDNYNITYTAGTLNIGKAALTVTADNQQKVYDGLEYTGGTVTYSGFVNGENNSVLGGVLVFTGSSQHAINAGTGYVISPAGYTSGNYDISYAAGSLTISKAPLIITANDATKVYDGNAYTGGNGITCNGLVNGEAATVLGGNLTYSGTSQMAINTGNGYSILPGGLTSGNYDISFSAGNLTITPAILTITANDAVKCLNDANPSLSVTYTGFVHGETAQVLAAQPVVTTTAQQSSTPGNYPVIASGANASNYTITYINGTLLVKAQPVVTISASAQTLCGPNATSTLIASGNYAMEWSLDNKVLAGNGSTFNATETGTYTATATDANGCSAPATNDITLTRLFAPAPDFSYDKYCINLPVNFTNKSQVAQSGAVSYTWSVDDGQQSSDLHPQFSFANAGIYNITLTAIPDMCPELATSIYKSIKTVAPPKPVRLPNIRTSAGLPTQLRARTTNGSEYLWAPATGLDNPTSPQPVTTLQHSQLYQISMTMESGCQTTDTLVVLAVPYTDILVANAFSPNNDGRNDILHISLRGMQQLKYFRIFNRNGQQIFESRSESTGWDGRLNGVIQPLGTYVWIAEAIDTEGKTVQKTGTVVLLQ
ncbi:MBG domain-containing protein [Chitinophaga sp. Cy-1792]|uniref:MBG domain-containing protein n=1 Tax=Chitinophaga sp. Cy-1792 TaxID=2608339 RepID=UPI0014249CBC|nr:MBG domain-containing protein [Chitinophaga sp. Cy-1792]NIG55934.1 T9SS type B sorting domain-containing protein [Chitinophaga sp. Cy-1792]